MEKKIIPVILAADENYFTPLVVTISSVMAHANPNDFYDFRVLVDKPFSNEKITFLKGVMAKGNCSIKTEDMSAVNKNLKSRISHISIATFYRLWATDVLSEYDKCIYLDVDISVVDDLALLYSFNVSDFYIAGVKAPPFHLHPDGYRSHCNKLGIPSIDHYVNAGVLLMNLRRIREDKIDIQMQQLIGKDFPVQDQDIFNVACYGHILLLPPKYNLMITRDISKEDMYVVFGKEGTEEAYNNACIIHYAGKLKPWQSPLLEFSFQWWNVAIMLPSFHDIWDNMVEKLAENEIINKTSVEYRIGSLFTFIPQKFSLLFSFIKDYGFKGLAYKIKEKFK